MDSFFLFDRSTGMVMAVPTAVACFHSSPGFQVSLVLPGQWHICMCSRMRLTSVHSSRF